MLSQLELLAGADTTPFSASRNHHQQQRAASSPAPSSSSNSNKNKIFLRSPLSTNNNNGLSVDVSPATGNSKKNLHFFDDSELFQNNNHHTKQAPSSMSPSTSRPEVATSLSPSFDQVVNNYNQQTVESYRSPSYFSNTRSGAGTANSVSPQPTQPAANGNNINKPTLSSPKFLGPSSFTMTSTADDTRNHKKQNNAHHDNLDNFVTPSSVYPDDSMTSSSRNRPLPNSNEEFLSTMLHELQSLNEKNRVLIDEKAELLVRAERAEGQLQAAHDETERVKIHHQMLSRTSLELQEELSAAKEQLDEARDEIQRLISTHAQEQNELASRLAREEAFACSANSELHIHRSSLEEFRSHEKELRGEVEIAHDQMMEMAREFDESKSKLESRVSELRNFVSDLQIRVEEAESEARDAEDKRRHAENLLISVKQNQQISSNHQTPPPSSSHQNKSASSLKEQHQKKISDLEAALEHQQEEHRKRMKRQVKLEHEIENLKSSLQAATSDVEKQHHRYNMIVSPTEQLALVAAECRDAINSCQSLAGQQQQQQQVRGPSVQALLTDDDDEDQNNSSDSDSDSSSSSSSDIEVVVQPGDSLLVIDVDDESVESAPTSTVPSESRKKKHSNKKSHHRKEKKSSKSSPAALPPVHPSTTTKRASSSTSHQPASSVKTTKNRNRSPSPSTTRSNKSNKSAIESTPVSLLRGANPLFQLQFTTAILKKLIKENMIVSSEHHKTDSDQILLLERQQHQCKAVLDLNDQLKLQIKELRTKLVQSESKSSQQNVVLQSEHDHAIKERESADSLAEQLRKMTEDFVSQSREQQQYEQAVKNLTHRLEQQTFEINEMKCNIKESKLHTEKLQQQLTKAQNDKQAAESHARRDRESAENSKKDLETAKKSVEESKEKFEKHKELLQNSLRKEQRRYTKALQHADKLEAKFIAAQTEVGTLTSKLRSSENEIAAKLRHIQSLESRQKETVNKVQKTEAKLSKDDEKVEELTKIIVEYDRALSMFCDIIYRNTEYRCIAWDLTVPVSSNSSNNSDDDFETMTIINAHERSQVASQFLNEFGDFTLLHLKLLDQAEMTILVEREKVEFLNSELEVYRKSMNDENITAKNKSSNKKTEEEETVSNSHNNHEEKSMNDSDLSMIRSFIANTPSPSMNNKNKNKSSSSSSKKKKHHHSSSSSSRKRHATEEERHHVNDSDFENDDYDRLEKLAKAASPPRSLFL